MEFHAVEARRNRQLCCPAILFDDSGDFFYFQEAGRLERLFPAERVDLPGDPETAMAEGATGRAWAGSSDEWDTRPACMSWTKMRPPAAWTASVTFRQPAACSFECRPGG
jgi:hypothetical protein